MDCPQCGVTAHRSRPRHAGENLIKSFTRYNLYRCPECGWRGMRVGSSTRPRRDVRRMALFWTLGVALALAVGLFALTLMSALDKPGKSRRNVTAPSR